MRSVLSSATLHFAKIPEPAMTSTARKILICSHLAVLGLGVMLSLRVSQEPKPQVSSSDEMTASGSSSEGSIPAQKQTVRDALSVSDSNSSAVYAAAWDSLKGRFLPKQDRLLIEKTLLEEWSVIDLASAVRAVFAETTDQGPNGFGKVGILTLLECCAPGIQKDPLKAWKLIPSNAFGWETVRFRSAWLSCMIEANPVLVFSILDELPKHERLATLSRLAEASCTAKNPTTRAAIWTQLSALPDTPSEQESLTRIGESICFYTAPEELTARLLDENTPAARKIYISAMSLALFEVMEDDEFPKPLLLLPAMLRGEVAATSLKYGLVNEERALILATIALDSGNLDALQEAAANPSFLEFTKEMKKPLALVNWALRLPEDPRTLGIYRQSIEGAASKEYETIQAKIRTLPPGWQREQGLAALATVKERNRAEDE